MYNGDVNLFVFIDMVMNNIWGGEDNMVGVEMVDIYDWGLFGLVVDFF